MIISWLEVNRQLKFHKPTIFFVNLEINNPKK